MPLQYFPAAPGLNLASRNRPGLSALGAGHQPIAVLRWPTLRVESECPRRDSAESTGAIWWIPTTHLARAGRKHAQPVAAGLLARVCLQRLPPQERLKKSSSKRQSGNLVDVNKLGAVGDEHERNISGQIGVPQARCGGSSLGTEDS